jgi:hypothetical protein
VIERELSYRSGGDCVLWANGFIRFVKLTISAVVVSDCVSRVVGSKGESLSV